MSDTIPHIPDGLTAAELLDDQSRRWQQGNCVQVEDYLRCRSALGDDRALLLDLIYHEVLLREKRGEAPQLEEYQRRFPDLAGPLQEQLALRSALGATLAEPGATAATLGAPPPGQPRPPRLGPYLLLDRLGCGGMGEVLRARDEGSGQQVALKVIHRGRLSDDEAVRRFQREARAAARLAHPNVVAVLDAGAADGESYLVMEYVEGMDLARLVRDRGALPVPAACDYVRQAALALQHAHERGIVHRDVKPSNLMLTPQGVVKLLDLGLARLERTPGEEGGSVLTGSGVVLGTADYIAPEQIRDPRIVDGRADLYSLGCTFYHLLAGLAPFTSSTLGHRLVMHQTQQAGPLSSVRPEVPAAVAAVVEKLMAKRPDDRFQTPAELAAVLAGLLAEGRWEPGSPVEKPTAEAARNDKPPVARRVPRGALVVVAVLLGALALAAFLVYLR